MPGLTVEVVLMALLGKGKNIGMAIFRDYIHQALKEPERRQGEGLLFRSLFSTASGRETG